MEPAERRERLRELATWVDWLRRTFELHNAIPACWYRHSPAVEHLTALYAGWVRTYSAEPGAAGRDLAEADWINALHAFVPHLRKPACASGRHEEPPVSSLAVMSLADDAFELFLVTSQETTAPARHPAEAEMARRSTALDPPL